MVVRLGSLKAVERRLDCYEYSAEIVMYASSNDKLFDTSTMLATLMLVEKISIMMESRNCLTSSSFAASGMYVGRSTVSTQGVA